MLPFHHVLPVHPKSVFNVELAFCVKYTEVFWQLVSKTGQYHLIYAFGKIFK